MFLFLVLLNLVLLSSATTAHYKHDLTCSPTNCSLSSVFKALKNDTKLRLLTGSYDLDQGVNLSYYRSVLITGDDDVHIECSGYDTGITFIRSHSIQFEKLSLSNCGAPFVGTSLYNITFLSVFNFVYCKDLYFFGVSVVDNEALAVNFYDVGGKVKFDSCVFSNNIRSVVDNRWGGGGVYVQFTYCGSFYGDVCTDSDDKEHQKYIHNNTYIFQNCSFMNNIAPEPPDVPGSKSSDFLPPQHTKHMSLGRGGGLSFYLRSNASHNHFLVEDCVFTNNYAVWGGGFFTEVVDNCYQNSFIIQKCTFTGNSARWAGGGVRYGLIQVFEDISPFINGTFIDNVFINNSAMWGGGASVYSTEEPLSLNGKATSQIKFINVTWLRNSASNGAAVGGASWKIISAGGVVVPTFANTTFKENFIVDYKLSSNNNSFYTSVIKGQGTICTNAMPFHFDDENYFMDNKGTVFLLTDAVLTVAGLMEFHRNEGHDGGAIALLGQSWINIHPGSKFLFSKNKALRGAGIFVQSPGTPNRVASKNCFITYNAATPLQSLISPENWKTFFNFSHNNASVAGHSIYCSTLKYCAWYMEVYGFHNNQLFNWTNFVYENTSPFGSEIATDPVEIVLDQNDWMNIAPSDVTNPTVKLVDERGQILPGVVFVGVENSNFSDTQVDVSSGPYFPSDEKIYSLQMRGKTGLEFAVDIQTTTGLPIKALVHNITLRNCRPGYRLKDNSRCVCLKSSDSDGITRCQGDNLVFVKKGLWAGTVTNHPESFVTLPCPSLYCNYHCPYGVSCAPNEYLYSEVPHQQCEGLRTGFLCGKCLPGYSVVLGSDHCKMCPDDSTWVAYLLLFLGAGTIVVVVVLFLDVDISTSYYTGTLFFYQVVYLLVRDGFIPDPALRFLMGLANAQVGMGACMWKGMTDLQKLALTYLLPTYILFLCLIFVLLTRMRMTRFSNMSALKAFTSLFLVSYTTFTSVSLELLHYTQAGDKKVLFKSGEVEYFHGNHVGYAILAIIVCSVIVVPFPLCLCLVQPLSYLKPGLGSSIKPFLDILQGCYKVEYRWFAGIYYLARIIILLVYTLVPDTGIKHGLLCCICITLLTLQSNICPYKPKEDEQRNRNNSRVDIGNNYGAIKNDKDPRSFSNDESQCKGTWVNILDSFLLMNLSFIALLGSFSTNVESQLTRLSFSNGLYSTADIICIVLMWLPAPYFIGLIIVNIYTFVSNRRKRAKALSVNRQQSENAMSETSDLIRHSVSEDT